MRNPLYDRGGNVSSDEGRVAFAAYVSAVLDRFGSCVAAIEVGNEINGGPHGISYPPGMDPAVAYVAVLKSLRTTVKPRHPRVAILGGSTNLIGTGFLDGLFRAGALDVMDGVAVHPYRSHAEGSDIELARLNAVMRRHGRTVPIWATEFGSELDSADAAPPLLVKMVTLLSASGVARAYWYALIDERWFRNMGLFEAGGQAKPAAAAFRAMMPLLAAGRAVRVDTGDRDVFLFRFGSDRWVAWGSPRTIRFTGHAAVRDAQGRPVAGSAMLGDAPLIVSGANGYTLGPSAVVADSQLEYGSEPWSYLARGADGTLHPLGLIDDRFDSFFGNRFYRPLRITGTTAAPAGAGAAGTSAVIRYTAPRAGAATLSACLAKKPAGDGVSIEIARNGKLLQRGLLRERLLLDGPAVDLAAGDTLDLIAGPNGAPGNDIFRYRIRLIARGATLAPICA